jgi:hypothetical protein
VPSLPRLRRLVPPAGLLLATLACGARAEPPVRLAPPPALPARLALRLPPSPYDSQQALKAAGIARTGLDHSFAGAAATASVGFLCGLAPAEAAVGAAGARGVDHDGRFLGAQLRLGFR